MKKYPALFALFLFCSSSVVFSQPFEIQGKIVNGTHQTEGKAEAVTLLGLGQGMQEIATLQNVRGAFQFPLKGEEAGPFLIRATYLGVHYFKMIGPFQAKQQAVHEVTVYDQVENLDKAVVLLPHLFIKRDGDKLIFAWNFEVQNPTAMTMSRPGGLFRISLPGNPEDLNVSASSGAMPLRVGLTKDIATGSFFVNYPIKPGKTSFDISYAVDYGKGDYALEQKIFYPLTKVLALIYPEDMRVESEGMQEMQVDAANHVKIVGWDSLAGGALWKIKVSGGSKIATPPEQENAMGNGENLDHPVVEKPPVIAKVSWLIWVLMALGLGVNVLFFFRGKSAAAPPRFEFPRLDEFRKKWTQLAAARASGTLDEKTFQSQRRETIKQAWNTYLEGTDGR